MSVSKKGSYTTIPVIDLFAGPGGLGEGFELLEPGETKFRISLSIEKNPDAHKTLRLRSFYRQFTRTRIPEDYYSYIQGCIAFETLAQRNPQQMSAADRIAWCAELGQVPETEVDERITHSLPPGKEWVLIGGPPCQAYSLAGRSRMSRVWENNPEIKQKDKRHFLFKEYLRIIGKHSPAVFVMENVKGILTAEMNGESIFSMILRDLKNPCSALSEKRENPPKYKLYSFVNGSAEKPSLFHDIASDPKGFIIRSEEYGVPQNRHRVIILGIRQDIDVQPASLKKTHGKVSVQDAIADLPALQSSVSLRSSKTAEWEKTIQGTPDNCSGWNMQISDGVRDCMKKHSDSLGRQSIREQLPSSRTVSEYRSFVRDPEIRNQCNHQSRSHMASDLQRYFFAACFAEAGGFSPKLKDFPKQLLPTHRNVDEGIKTSKFADRFRVQLRGAPSSTITCHISKDGHYYIHPDPQQCRSLTVREAARLQTFPDNYFFEGTRTTQYIQVGNAVPPLLALRLAEIVAQIMEKVNG